MCEQKRLIECGLAARDPRIRGDAGNLAKPGKDIFTESQRYQGWARFRHRQTKPAGDLVAKAGCPHFRDGFSSGCDDKMPAPNFCSPIAGKRDRKAVISPLKAFQCGSEAQFACRARHLIHQHCDDILGGIIAEELPERLFVIGNAMFLDQRNEIMLRVSAKRRFCEMWVVRQKVSCARADIGEVAATPA